MPIVIQGVSFKILKKRKHVLQRNTRQYRHETQTFWVCSTKCHCYHRPRRKQTDPSRRPKKRCHLCCEGHLQCNMFHCSNNEVLENCCPDYSGTDAEDGWGHLPQAPVGVGVCSPLCVQFTYTCLQLGHYAQKRRCDCLAVDWSA